MSKGGLGRGLNSLIPNKLNNQADSLSESVAGSAVDDTEKINQIPLNKIDSNPLQPREYFDHGDLEDLVNSIKQYGILQPLIVTKQPDNTYQLIAGERRFRASQILEQKTVPCIIRDADDLEKLEMALIENVQRSNLNPIEEAKAYQKLIDEFNLTQEEVGKRVGKKRATIANVLRLLDLPEDIQQALKENKISAGHAKVILSAESDPERLKIFSKILKLSLTVRQTEGEVRKIKVKSHDRIIEPDLEIKEKEDELRKALGTKVKINKKGEGGTVTIEYYSAEDLNELVEKLGD